MPTAEPTVEPPTPDMYRPETLLVPGQSSATLDHETQGAGHRRSGNHPGSWKHGGKSENWW